MSRKTTDLLEETPREETPWTQEEMHAWINRQDYQGLLSWWRFAPPETPSSRARRVSTTPSGCRN